MQKAPLPTITSTYIQFAFHPACQNCTSLNNVCNIYGWVIIVWMRYEYVHSSVVWIIFINCTSMDKVTTHADNDEIRI